MAVGSQHLSNNLRQGDAHGLSDLIASWLYLLGTTFLGKPAGIWRYPGGSLEAGPKIADFGEEIGGGPAVQPRPPKSNGDPNEGI